MYAATTRATPFRLNLHVGHTLMIGPPGAGKSSLLGAIAAQWFRYPPAKVIAFDNGYSLLALTAAAGGEFYDIGGERTHRLSVRSARSIRQVTSFGPWLESLCTLQEFKVTPRERNALAEAVLLLRNSPTRTLTELSANVRCAGSA